MKRKKNIILTAMMFLLLICGCLSYKTIFAEGNSVTFTLSTEIPADDPLEDDLVFDLYFIAPIEWDGRGDGQNADSTKYYIPSDDISEDYADILTPFADDKDMINVSERDGSLVNEDLKDYGLDTLANDLAAVVFADGSTISADHEGLEFDVKHPTEEEDPIENGLYLAIVRGANADDPSKYIKTKKTEVVDEESGTKTEVTNYYSFVNSKKYEYDFNPVLVFLRNTDDPERAATLTFEEKYFKNLRDDDLLIIKELSGFGSGGDIDSEEEDFSSFKPVIFVFSVNAYDEDGNKVYENTASISFDSVESADDLVRQTIVEKIPVGSRVEVEEIYSGPYTLDGTPEDETVIIASVRDDNGEHLIDKKTGLYIYEQAVESEDGEMTTETIFAYVRFVNTFNNIPNQGYGIDNPYEIDEDGIWKYTGDNTCEMPA